LAALPEVWRMLERGAPVEPPVLCELPVPALV
jgi:hypothetical protein